MDILDTSTFLIMNRKIFAKVGANNYQHFLIKLSNCFHFEELAVLTSFAYLKPKSHFTLWWLLSIKSCSMVLIINFNFFFFWRNVFSFLNISFMNNKVKNVDWLCGNNTSCWNEGHQSLIRYYFFDWEILGTISNNFYLTLFHNLEICLYMSKIQTLVLKTFYKHFHISSI